jgi:retron-type reverse transcriptase
METYFTFVNLHKAYLDCRKRKEKSLYHLKFAENLEANLFDLEKRLQNRTYKPGRSIAFIVQKPKIREIFAADFCDRVVHHLLHNYMSPIYERRFIHDSWACRTNKGTHGAMLRVREFARKLERERERERAGACGPFFLKMDIKSFFTTIDQQILYDLLCRKVKNEEILWLAKTIIFHDCAHDIPPKIQSQPSLFDKLPKDKSLFTVPKGKGLPIGNLTSQFFANVYLNELDNFAKHKLKAKYYLRYVDDFLILSPDREYLESCRNQITDFTKEKLKLIVHPDKQFIKPISCGIDFVGYIVRPDYVLVRKRIVADCKFKLSLAKSDPEKHKQIVNSYRAHFMWANTRSLQSSLFNPTDKTKIDICK